MKTKLILAVLASCVAMAFLTKEADAETTDPVGYYTYSLKPGPNLFAAGLVCKVEFQGDMSAAVGGSPNSTFTVNGNLTAGAFNEGVDYPTHYVEITESGHRAEGIVLDIVSNSATEIVVAADGAQLSALGIAGNEKISVRRHATLKTIFESAESNITVFGDFVDIYPIDGPSAKETYAWNGSEWVDFGSFLPRDDRVVYPGQGMVIMTFMAKDLVIGGGILSYVKTTPTQIPVYAGQVNLVAQVNPLHGDNETLGDIGFQNTFGQNSDSVDLYENLGNGFNLIGTFAWDGTKMVNEESLTDATNQAVPFTKAMNVNPLSDSTVKLSRGY